MSAYTQIPDFKTLQAMRHYGGGFASALARAAFHANADNLRRIKTAFPELWTEYQKLASRIAKNRPTDTDTNDCHGNRN